MPTQTYLVSFSPATRVAGGFQTGVSTLVGGTKHEVSAAGLDALEAEVRRLAVEFGQTCAPYVRLKDSCARKPRGFDAWCRTIQCIDFIANEGV